ncbi:heptaprenyl diphosphate synthase component II [Fervidibacillus halotolerans]|uniref:Heptaprenyl diphosphate synthase component 2 n=1 Tax=Fervidibacillus halotolerans TaxID=2980027 RepID=A0A9E8M219_9BACI|nr:heptaprenyl diphosphate synthase component II [Fervidibacillus halotolerans]WAA13761.1 heptaprenyl diphosphate synthase component II [Fervidibacillus halotolerans]
MNYTTVYKLLHNDLKSIENRLESVLDTESPLLRQSSLHYLQAGGKRIRPILVILSGKFGNYHIDKVMDVAVALELIHMASLIHDDVIDDAYTRRGRPTVKAKWDDQIAVYTGDFILAKSLDVITNIKEDEVHKVLSKTMVELSIGEIEQIQDKYNFDQRFTTYFRRIKRKTALLIAASCQLGALAAGAEKHIYQKLYRFGYYIGMAFQITDDILDFTSTAKKLGKPVGEDLLQGNITLPVLLAMKNPAIKKEIIKVHAYTEPEVLERIIQLIKETGSINQSIAVTRQYLKKALRILDELPNHEVKPLLQTIVDFIGNRKF